MKRSMAKAAVNEWAHQDDYEGKAGTDTSASMGTPYDTDSQLRAGDPGVTVRRLG
jgi:hypothetical protein